MSQQITEAFVLQFGSNIYHLSQQKGSKLQAAVRNESIQGKKKKFDRLGTVAAVVKTGRHAPTPQMDTPHSSRWVSMVDYQWADLIDDEDKLRMLIDPTSDYVMAAMWAFGRSKDDAIIAAASGLAYSGEDGVTTVALPDAQKVGAVAGAAFTNLNVGTLRLIKKLMDAKDIDESLPRYIGVTSSQIQALLGDNQITSADYNSVKALVQGEVNTYMGFNFIRTERFVNQSATASQYKVNNTTGLISAGAAGGGETDVASSRKCLAWVGDAIVLATGKDVMSKVDQRSDLSYATQAYAAMSIGAARMDEDKVIEVFCKES
jgi:hypothetical protein